MTAGPLVLVLTPVKDAAAHLDTYFQALSRLTYPKPLLSLGFLESDSTDNTYTLLGNRLEQLNGVYRRAGLWKKDFQFRPRVAPWTKAIQPQRRAVLAKARNHLLLHALDDEEWVLWLDVDVVDYPADILETLLATGKEIVHPNCVIEAGGRNWDTNAWRDHGRLHLDDLRSEGNLVPIDSVGGTMLLVRADVHRDGVIFPPFPYGLANPKIRTNNQWRGELETEGFGIMAADAGVQCWGMPNLEIRHYNREAAQRRTLPPPPPPAPAPVTVEAEDETTHYRALFEERLRTLPREAPPGFHGRGIVICAGGDVYFPSAWVCISMLRRNGCTLPIELWYRGRREMTDDAIALMQRHGVTCHDAYPIAREQNYKRLDSWEIKPFAVAYSRFQEVLLLDADNVPLRNPEFLFADPQYVEHGSLFWPDRSGGSTPNTPTFLAPEAWRVCGLEPRQEAEFESGQLLVDKSRCWPELLLTLFFNSHSDYYYSFFFGDKDTFNLAWRKLGRAYGIIPHRPDRFPTTLQQFSRDRRPLFNHRVHDKWRLDVKNRVVPQFQYEGLCREALDELRRSWKPPMRSFPAEFTSFEKHQYEELTAQRRFAITGPEESKSRVEFFPDFSYTSSIERGRGRWMIEEDKDGQAVLRLSLNSNYILRRGDGNVWLGRRRYQHRRIAEMRPV